MKYKVKLAAVAAIFILTATVFCLSSVIDVDICNILSHNSVVELIKEMLCIEAKNGDPRHDALLTLQYSAAAAVAAGGCVYIAVCLFRTLRRHLRHDKQ